MHKKTREKQGKLRYWEKGIDKIHYSYTVVVVFITCTTMFWKSYQYNGQDISHTDTLGGWRVGIEKIERQNVESRNQKTPIAWYHGSRKTPTYLTGRTITIEGGILCDTRAQSVSGLNYLRNLFAIEPITWQGAVTREFRIQDEQDNRRWCDVSIDKPIQFDERDDDILDWDTRKRRVVLYAQDPRLLGEVITETGDEWHLGWFTIPFTMNNRQRLSTYNAIQCINAWSEPSPMKITITATDSIKTPLSVVNMATLKEIVIDVNALAGDIIVIDSYNRTITKNAIDITYLKRLWSVWPSAIPGSNDIVVSDLDGGLLGSDFDVSIEFYTIMI